VKTLKQAISVSKVPRGTGYYIHPQNSCVVYICWRDTRPVCVMSTAFPGHLENMVTRKKANRVTGNVDTFQILRLIMVEK
jgi:hypothetical protein